MRKINQTIQETVIKSEQTILSVKEKRRIGSDLVQTFGALTCLLVSYVYRFFFPAQEVVAGLICLVGIVFVGVPILLTAIRGFLQKEFSSAMEILVSIAMLISMLNGEYTVAILIPLLLTLVHFIEEKSVLSGKDAVEGLRKMQSSTAIQIVEGKECTVDAKTLKTGDVIRVLAGMSFPIDGKVMQGSSHVDQQSLSGEAMPCSVQEGDAVFAGTLNMEGALLVQVEKTYQDTSFQKIVQLLEKSQEASTSESRLMDRFLAYYIPITLLIATAVWLFTTDINRAVTILVVSCPCGHMLIHSAPMIMVLSACMKRGILIRNIAFIEKLSQVNQVFFDKTGTLTTGKLAVDSISPCEGYTSGDVLNVAMSLATHSTHPLSKAIASMKDQIAFDDQYEIVEKRGFGVQGEKDGHVVLLGNVKWLQMNGVEIQDSEHSEALSESYIAKDGAFLGVIRFSDTLRETAPSMVEELFAMGIDEVNMLTGDREVIAERIKEQCHLTRVFARQLPQDKQSKIESAKEEACVAFIGDGINDTLALSSADVGIAMGAMGADAAIQSADISLMNDHLDLIPYILHLSVKSNEIIHQNLIIAFATSFAMIFLATTGMISVLPGALLHNLGAVFVLLNSSRIMAIQTKSEKEAEKEAENGSTVAIKPATQSEPKEENECDRIHSQSEEI